MFDMYRRFGAINCNLQDRTSIFQTDATNFSETLLRVYPNVKRDLQQDININLQVLFEIF